eukprot:Em0001g3122a
MKLSSVIQQLDEEYVQRPWPLLPLQLLRHWDGNGGVPLQTCQGGWDRGKPAALDLTITSPLCSAILSESCHQAGAAALAAEAHKLHSNELDWSCILLAVETYGNWGKEAHDTFSRLAFYLAIHQSSPKSAVLAEIYHRLNIALVRSIARAILARELPPS